MKKRTANKSWPKTFFDNFFLPTLFGFALYHLIFRAFESSSPRETAVYGLLVFLSALAFIVLISPTACLQISAAILRRFTFKLFPKSRFAKPPLSYTRARRFVADQKYDEAIVAFQEILRHYPDEKEPYSQIIWIANLTGQDTLAKNFLREFQERFE